MRLSAAYQKVSNFFTSFPDRSVRQAAAALEMSKSAVDRQRQSERRRTQYPESVFWNTEAGWQWLCRLVLGSLFVFTIQRGIGLESLSYFFQLLRLDTHLGLSPSSLRNLVRGLEEEMLEYEAHCQRQVQLLDQPVEAVLGVDETFFEHMILVGMELASGFLVVEELASSRTYERWRQTLGGLTPWRLQVRQVISDRAKALIKLAHEGLQCLHLPDLFHAAHEVVKAMGLPFQRQINRAHQRLRESQESFQKLEGKARGLPPKIIADILQEPQAQVAHCQQEYQRIVTGQTHYHEALQAISHTLHPFAVSDSTPQTSSQVEAALQQIAQRLQTLQEQFALSDAGRHLEQFKKQIQDLAASVDFWWRWVEHSLLPEHLRTELYAWITTCLLPVCYWREQFRRTDQPTLRQLYQTLAQHTQNLLATHPLSQTLPPEEIQEWQQWAEERVRGFQRTSSAVEGRNGSLALVYHHRRGLTAKRLRVLTVIHNFALKRPDGTTAAQRLYRLEFPDLWEYLLQHPLPVTLSRQSKKHSVSNSMKLITVPL